MSQSASRETRAKSTSRRIRRRVILGLAALAAIAAVAPATSQADVRVMTRNLYLGADLSPGTRPPASRSWWTRRARSSTRSTRTSSRIARQGAGARRSWTRSPDLVGLQEVALWRTAPCTDNPLASDGHPGPLRLPRAAPQAAEQGQAALPLGDRPARVRLRGVGEHGQQRGDVRAGLPARQRDQRPADDARRDPRPHRRAREDLERARAPTSRRLLQVKPGGLTVDVTRGWTSVDAQGPGSAEVPLRQHPPRGVRQPGDQPHQPARTSANGQIREAQAKELFATGGPADRQAAGDPASAT